MSEPIAVLHDQLRASEQSVVHLLAARPDLTQPLPADLLDLAARSLSPASTLVAIATLDDELLLVASAMAADACDLLPQHLSGPEPVDELRSLGLIIGEKLSPQVLRALGSHPLGLPPRRPGDLDEETTRARLEHLNDDSRELLERLSAGNPVGSFRHGIPASGFLRDLVRTGLLVVIDDNHLLAPRPTVLMVRGGLLGPLLPTPPRLAVTTPPQALDKHALASLAAWLVDGGVHAEYPPRISALLADAVNADRWVRMVHAREDGSVQIDVVRVLLVAQGSAHTVRRAGRRLTVPLPRIVSLELLEPVVINGLAVD